MDSSDIARPVFPRRLAVSDGRELFSPSQGLLEAFDLLVARRRLDTKPRTTERPHGDLADHQKWTGRCGRLRLSFVVHCVCTYPLAVDFNIWM
jgi:hypothetical protein